MRVLLVEDDADLMEVIPLILKTFGIEIEEANTPTKAIELIAETKYDVVISDFLMKEMNGIELFEHVNGVNGLSKKIPFIILTGADKEMVKLEPVNGVRVFLLSKGEKDVFFRLAVLIKEAAQQAANY